MQPLMVIGLACVVSAVVGGGLKLATIEVPIISSTKRQVLLALGGCSDHRQHGTDPDGFEAEGIEHQAIARCLDHQEHPLPAQPRSKALYFLR